MQTIENLMRDRDPLYTEVRDFSLDTDKLSFNQMCKELLKELGKGKNKDDFNRCERQISSVQDLPGRKYSSSACPRAKKFILLQLLL